MDLVDLRAGRQRAGPAGRRRADPAAAEPAGAIQFHQCQLQRHAVPTEPAGGRDLEPTGPGAAGDADSAGYPDLEQTVPGGAARVEREERVAVLSTGLDSM